MIPKHFELHKPILEYLCDGEQHSLKDLKTKWLNDLTYRQKNARKCFQVAGKPFYTIELAGQKSTLKKLVF